MRKNLLRTNPANNDNKVVFVELFFDLVFVFAITQIAHFLQHHFDLAGLIKTLFLTLAVWWVWIYTTWVTNWLDPQKMPVRIMLFVLMLSGLILSVAIPQAFGGRATWFAGAYVFMQLGRTLFMCWALCKQSRDKYHNFVRIAAWFALSSIFWILGTLKSSEARYALWSTALSIEFLSPMLGFWLPQLGKINTEKWDLSGAHMAERCGLLIIIALGESMLMMGGTFTKLNWNTLNLTGFCIAFLSTVAMWWIYFNIGAECAAKRIAKAANPAAIARLAYTYLHLPMIAGMILAAVSDHLVLTRPSISTCSISSLTIVGGPALFLFGNLLFKRSVFGHYQRSHILGTIALCLLLPLYPYTNMLILATLATCVLLLVGAWENCSFANKNKLG